MGGNTNPHLQALRIRHTEANPITLCIPTQRGIQISFLFLALQTARKAHACQTVGTFLSLPAMRGHAHVLRRTPAQPASKQWLPHSRREAPYIYDLINIITEKQVATAQQKKWKAFQSVKTIKIFASKIFNWHKAT